MKKNKVINNTFSSFYYDAPDRASHNVVLCCTNAALRHSKGGSSEPFLSARKLSYVLPISPKQSAFLTFLFIFAKKRTKATFITGY